MTKSFETFKSQCIELFTSENLFKGQGPYFLNYDNFALNELLPGTFTWTAYNNKGNVLRVSFLPSFGTFRIDIETEFGPKTQVEFFSNELKEDDGNCKFVILRLFERIDEFLKTTA